MQRPKFDIEKGDRIARITHDRAEYATTFEEAVTYACTRARRRGVRQIVRKPEPMRNGRPSLVAHLFYVQDVR